MIRVGGGAEYQTATGKSDIPGEPEHRQEKTSLKPWSQQSTPADASGSVFFVVFIQIFIEQLGKYMVRGEAIAQIESKA